MKVSNQLLRVVKEEMEALDYGKVTISINVSGPYIEISSERRIRLIKDKDIVDEITYHRG